MEIRQPHRNIHICVRRQRLLRLAALLTEIDQSARRGRGGRIQILDGLAQHRHHMRVDGLVEIDPTEAIHTLRRTEDSEPRAADTATDLTGADAQHSCVERAATEVVHGDNITRLKTVLFAIVGGRRLGLSEKLHIRHVGEPDGFANQVELVLAVVGGVGDNYRIGQRTLLLDHPVVHRTQQVRRQRLGTVGRAAQHERNRITKTTLELAPYPCGLGPCASLRRLTDQHLAIVPDEHDRRDHRSRMTQRDDVGAALARNSGSRERRTQVDTDDVSRSRRHHVAVTMLLSPSRSIPMMCPGPDAPFCLTMLRHHPALATPLLPTLTPPAQSPIRSPRTMRRSRLTAQT